MWKCQSSTGYVIAVLSMVFSGLAGAQEPAAAAPAAVPAPQFAKLRLGLADAKLLVFTFDESKGAGTGYDSLRIQPVNFTAAPQTILGKKPAGTKSRTGGRTSGKLFFGPVSLTEFQKAAEIADGEKPVVVDVGFLEIQEDVEGKADYQEMMSIIAKQSSEKAAEMEAKGRPSFFSTWARFTLSARDAAGIWEYKATQPLTLANSQAAAFLLDPTGKPALELFADAEEGKLQVAAVIGRTGLTRISLHGMMPRDVMISSIRNNEQPVELQVTVKDADGKIVARLAGAPDFFWPAVGDKLLLRSKANCLLPVKGKYSVEATVNLGPLGGELTASKKVISR